LASLISAEKFAIIETAFPVLFEDIGHLNPAFVGYLGFRE
jgi:hypothetical protein